MTKKARVKLDWEDYKHLHERVLERDGWRCQLCGCSRDLQVHHIRARSRLGDDAEHNLITLCVSCHQEVHTHKGLVCPAG